MTMEKWSKIVLREIGDEDIAKRVKENLIFMLLETIRLVQRYGQGRLSMLFRDGYDIKEESRIETIDDGNEIGVVLHIEWKVLPRTFEKLFEYYKERLIRIGRYGGKKT